MVKALFRFLFPIAFCMFALSACRKEKSFQFENLKNPKLIFSEINTGTGKYPKTIFRNKSEDIELHIFPGENLDLAEAQKSISEKLAQIDILYGVATPAYRGTLTKLELCPPEFDRLVWKSPDGLKIIYGVYANNRHTLGVCDPKQISLKAAYLLVFCKKAQKLYEAKLFSARLDRARLMDLAKEISCQE